MTLWLEMSRDAAHGGGAGWGFTESLWAPLKKQGSGGRWPFWDSLARVREGDLVMHLRGVGPAAAFTGSSTAVPLHPRGLGR